MIRKRETLVLLCILAVAAAVRLWHFPSYIPLFWDEAKYLCEVEGIIPHFSVNVGAFACLRLGYAVFGGSSYAQIVGTIVGVTTVFGFFLLGKRLPYGGTKASSVGLLMAGQAALMPYLVKYSRHAFPSGFALCVFVYALCTQLDRLNLPQVRKRHRWLGDLGRSVLTAGLFAAVPACSFNLLAPTVIVFVLGEIVIWLARSHKRRDHAAWSSLGLSLAIGLALFVLVPLALATVSGYAGWADRAATLLREHGERKTLRLAAHFLFPIHVYYLAGSIFLAGSMAGLAVLFAAGKLRRPKSPNATAALILTIGSAVYIVFFGFLSHLQSARLYVTALPLLMYSSSAFLLWLRHAVPRAGLLVAGVVGLLLAGSMGNILRDYLPRTAGLQAIGDAVASRLQPQATVYANAGAQLAYSVTRSPNTPKVSFQTRPVFYTNPLGLDPQNAPLVVLQDGIDLVSNVAYYDKFDIFGDIDTLRLAMRGIRAIDVVADRVTATRADFYTSPYYYLEDLYSWRSYAMVRSLMAEAGDSIVVYRFRPPSDKPTLPR